MTETVEPYANHYTEIYRLNDSKKLSIGGKDYKTGYTMGDYSEKYIMFNLNGQYKEIKGMLGATKWGSLSTRDINIYHDGNLYKTISVDPNELPKEITIPVKGVMQLRLESPYESKSGNTFIGLEDFVIK